ncbi:MAG: RNA methyltransferase [Clostridia bacterium]|nr:RNA methyltransferase [Clostridia bacterium]
MLRFFEPEPGVFIAESKTVMEIALDCGFEPINVICFENKLDDEILNRVGDAPIYVVDPEESGKRFGYVLTGGISAAMRRKAPADFKEVIKNANRIVVLEDVENPTNLGAIMRSAAALGIDAVLLSPACVDPLYRRARRVSVGTSMLVPWAYVCETEAEWQEKGIELLKAEGFTTAAMALREDNININDPVLKGAEKLAIIMGNEGNGLTEKTIKACDYVAKIPMRNGVDSLNVAVAAGIAMWILI